MDSVQYCRDKVAPPGSTLHYSLMFLPEAKRHAALGLFTFHRQVTDIARRSSDPTPRQAQLDWWQDELRRLYAGEARHHASQLLLPALAELKQELFQEILESAAMDCDDRHYASFADLEWYCHRKTASLWMLAARLFGESDITVMTFARELGTGLELARILLELGRDCARGQLYLPVDELRTAGIEPETLLAGTASEALNSYLAEFGRRVEQHLEAADATLAREWRHQQAPGLIQAALRRCQLELAVRRGLPVLTETVELSPLRKLWTAWRTHRRERS